jgi:hypothetical protein
MLAGALVCPCIQEGGHGALQSWPLQPPPPFGAYHEAQLGLRGATRVAGFRVEGRRSRVEGRQGSGSRALVAVDWNGRAMRFEGHALRGGAQQARGGHFGGFRVFGFGVFICFL